VKAITGNAPAPQPKKRRRTEETGRAAFKMAAKRIMRRAVTVPVIADAVEFLSDTLDWLNPYWNAALDEPVDDFQRSEQNDLSLHL
jgi:hypothetical protein